MVILIIFLLAATSVQAGDFLVRSNPYDPVLWRYFNDHPPALLVNIQIGADTPREQINYSVFQDWQALHFSESTRPPEAVSSRIPFFFRYGSHSSPNNSKAASLDLDQICEGYFTERPTFMAISHHDIDYLLGNSSFWNKPQCVPKLLLLKFSQHSSKALEEGQWALIERAADYAIYLHRSSQAEYNEKSAKAAKAEQALPTLEWNAAISNIEKFIASKAKTAQDEPAFKIYDVRQKVISIGDILDDLTADLSEISQVVMRNYNADYNVIIAGNQAARTTFNVSNFVLENVTVNQKISFLFPTLPSQRLRLIEVGSDQSECADPYDVEQQVFVKIRGKEPYAAQSFVELGKAKRSSKPAPVDATPPLIQQDPLYFKDLDEKMPKIEKKVPLPPTKPTEQDNTILKAMASILILALVVFALRQIYLKWQQHQTSKIVSATQSQNKMEESNSI